MDMTMAQWVMRFKNAKSILCANNSVRLAFMSWTLNFPLRIQKKQSFRSIYTAFFSV